MRRLLKSGTLWGGIICFALLAAAFPRLRGYARVSDKTIAYYQDPMHPAYKSDKPGIAPDCGMALQAVYAGQAKEAVTEDSASSGTVRITEGQQREIGLRTETVKVGPVSETIRLLARVAADETRSFVINAPIDGWIENAGTATTGSVVRKGDKLGSFYNPEFLTSQQTYILSLATGERQGAPPSAPTSASASASATARGAAPHEMQENGDPSRPNLRQITEGQRFLPMGGIQATNIQRYADVLKNLGMDERQLEEIGRSRKPAREIFIYAPADGIILSRNITAGQRFVRGTDWFRIADLSRVWVVADAFENEASLLSGVKGGVLLYRGSRISLQMSDVQPVFDPETRVLKLRFVTANPGGKLRPGMFGDVELEVRHKAAITVPVDSISDNGTRKVVFFERAQGTFEPRAIRTGPTLNGRVVVEDGLAEGERIVVSGNFLIDSESRLRIAEAPTAPKKQE